MAILRNKEMQKMSNDERDEKIKDLRMELIKSKIVASKGGKLKTKEIKRTIARLFTFNRQNQKETVKAKKPLTKETETKKTVPVKKVSKKKPVEKK